MNNKTHQIVNQGEIISIEQSEYEILSYLFYEQNINIDYSSFNSKFIELPRQYVGILNLPSRKIIIKPKVDGLNIDHILRLYYFVYINNKIDLDDSLFSINEGENKDLSKIFIEELIEILKIGLPVSYSEKSIYSKHLTGTLNLLSTKLNITMKKSEPFNVSVSELSKDIDINRILFLAYRKIYDIVDKDVRGFLDSNFQKISRLNRINNIPNITRNIKYCEKALTLAIVIIESLSITGNEGQFFGESFLINFDDLFEKFIQKVLIEYSEDHLFSVWDNPHFYGEYNNSIVGIAKKTYQPDLLYNYRKNYMGEFCSCILDMKNKTSAPFSSADVYQMIFYSTMLKSPKVILCYPASEYKETTVLNLFNDQIELNKINAIYMNLNGNSANEFKENIKKFINEIFSIIEN